MSNNENNPLSMRLSAVALLVAIFAAGAASGAGIYRWAAHDHDPPDLRPRMGHRMLHEELGLSPEQSRQAEAIMHKHRPELEAVIRETFPRVKAVHDKIDDEIRTILNDEQRKRFDEFRAQRARAGEPGRLGGRPGGPFGRGFPGPMLHQLPPPELPPPLPAASGSAPAPASSPSQQP